MGRQSLTTGTPSSLQTLNTSGNVTESSPSYTQREDVTTYESDFQYLDGIGTAENTSIPNLSHPFRIFVGSLEEVAQHISQSSGGELCIPLLRKQQTMELFEFYMERMDSAQHILHPPTVRHSLEALFRDIEAGYNIAPNRTVLLLAICTTVATYWAFLEKGPMSFFASTQQAKDTGFHWLRTTLDVLEHVRRSGPATLETVQASIFVVFLLYKLDGLSPRARAVHGSAVVLAKDLGLHQVDSRSQVTRSDNQLDIIDREMERRVWWHLAATDWSLSMIGPHVGTYAIHPTQMKVRKPRNISDDELASKPEDFTHSMSEVTVMSYYMQRIRLGEISRQVADLVNLTSPEDMTFDEIYAIENEFQSVLAEVPDVLRLDGESQSTQSQHLDPGHASFAVQRYVLNITLQARRCKFHWPFVLRAAHDDRYAPFRIACLRAARVIVQAHRGLSNDLSFLYVSSSRLNDILHHFFYATVVLVMEYCINKGFGEEAATKTEIQDACKTLEAAKNQPGAAGMFLDSLMAILRKHQVKLQGQDHLVDVNESVPVVPVHSDTLASVPKGIGEWNNDSFMSTSDFDQLWQSFIDLDSVDTQTWDDLMNDIEMVQ